MSRIVALTPMAVLRVVLIHVLIIVAIPSVVVMVVILVVVVVTTITALVILLLLVVGIAVKVDLKVLFGHFSQFDAQGTS